MKGRNIGECVRLICDLVSNVLENILWDKFWYNTLYELESLTPKFDLFWRDAIVNYAKIHEMPSTAKKTNRKKNGNTN